MSTIKSFELKRCVQRQQDPGWTFARATVPELPGWILVLTDQDGQVGHGYAHAIAAITTHGEGAEAGLRFLAPRLVGRDPTSIAAVMDDLDLALAASPSPKAAIDMALHDLLARRLGVPLHALLGGARRAVLPQARILSIKSPADMAERARGLVAQGYRTLKLKLAGDAETDVARVRAVREAIGPAPNITLDPNQTYSAKGIIAAFRSMERHDIALIEQPVAAADLAGLKLVTDTLPVPVEADESADSLAVIWRIAGDRMADCVNLKITKLGGIRNVLAAMRICEAGGLACRFGAAFGPSLLQAMGAQVAACARDLPFASELSEHTHLLDDPCTPLPVEGGDIVLPSGPGCGVSLRDGATEEAA
ncbi:mandelate racemase/muconate lactonizing enzyme family protein [Rhodoplanes roseus]|nr:enolase C-terminal domain-like protein [Rhodoplanes roseus]